MYNLDLLQDLDSLKVAFLPIKPIYAERIMNGTKKFEFRRKPFSADVTHVVVYASSPYKRILGIVKVKSIESGSAHTIWSKTKDYAGIKRADFFDYFFGAPVAYAIAIDSKETIRLRNHICPKEIEQDFVVPQSFRYIGPEFMKVLLSKEQSNALT